MRRCRVGIVAGSRGPKRLARDLGRMHKTATQGKRARRNLYTDRVHHNVGATRAMARACGTWCKLNNTHTTAMQTNWARHTAARACNGIAIASPMAGGGTGSTEQKL